ncbi:2TM domain-containing protein [Lacinutrix venerupis]|uniref:Histidine kinase n=1 Tax=Lacinutrix venerupis TaxID=1486034 RepID=A0AAC9LMY5_9FLAO|nr:2TM domain-containing protein [Lacinutrix venerupis]APY01470.1 histidine kinase [Lacinutrix venerupis]
MNTNQIDQQRLERAKKRVKRIKGFYTHLLIYIVINTVIVFINIDNLKPGQSYFQWYNFITLTIWGIPLIIHGLTVFLPNFILGTNWEERKIKEIMENENNVWE